MRPGGIPATFDLDFVNDRTWVNGTQPMMSSLITYVRTSAGTTYYQNADGTLRQLGQNMCLQSQTLEHATWAVNGDTVVPNAITAPDGTLTADKIEEDASAAAAHGQRQTFTGTILGNSYYTISFYAKAAERTKVMAYSYGSGVNISGTVFDLAAGTMATPGGGLLDAYAHSMTLVGDGWWRCVTTLTSDADGGDAILHIGPASSSGDTTYDGIEGFGAYFWGVQYEIGPVANPYQATTTTAKSVMRIGDNGLLAEYRRVNLAPYSQAFDTTPSPYTYENITIDADTTAAPDGTTTADTLGHPGALGAAWHSITQNIHTTTDGVTYTVSCFVKNKTGNGWIAISTANNDRVWFDVKTGLVGTEENSNIGDIVALANGWFRIAVTFTKSGTSADPIGLTLTNADNVGPPDLGAEDSQERYLWGFQLEVGGAASSYIPTLGSSVERADEFYTINSIPFYNQSAGTFFAKAHQNLYSESATIFTASDGTFSNFMCLQTSPSAGRVVGSGSIEANFSTNGYGLHKYAVAYAANDIEVWYDNFDHEVDTGATLPTVTRLELGYVVDGQFLNGYINRFAYWSERLPSTTLEELADLDSSYTWALDAGAEASLDLELFSNRGWDGSKEVTAASLLTCARDNAVAYAENNIGELIAFGPNEPRITTKGLLSEVARTNLLKQSTSIGTGFNWSVSGATLTPNIAQSPANDMTAALWVPNAGTTGQSATIVAGVGGVATTYTISLYIKSAGGNVFQLQNGNGEVAVFDLSDASIPATNLQVTDIPFIYPLANGWYRVGIRFVAPVSAGGDIFMATHALDESWNGVKGFYVWGHQYEAAACETSYIPTPDFATVTRPADAVEAINGYVVNRTSLTVFEDALLTTISNTSRILGGGPNAGAFVYTGNDDPTVYGFFDDFAINITATSGSEGWRTVGKAMQSIAPGDIDIIFNNGSINTSSGNFIPQTKLWIGSSGGGSLACNGYVRRIVVWPVKLANAVLQALTTV